MLKINKVSEGNRRQPGSQDLSVDIRGLSLSVHRNYPAANTHSKSQHCQHSVTSKQEANKKENTARKNKKKSQQFV